MQWLLDYGEGHQSRQTISHLSMSIIWRDPGSARLDSLALLLGFAPACACWGISYRRNPISRLLQRCDEQNLKPLPPQEPQALTQIESCPCSWGLLAAWPSFLPLARHERRRRLAGNPAFRPWQINKSNSYDRTNYKQSASCTKMNVPKLLAVSWTSWGNLFQVSFMMGGPPLGFGSCMSLPAHPKESKKL